MAGRPTELERTHQVGERKGLTGMISKEIENGHDASNTGRRARHQASRVVGLSSTGGIMPDQAPSVRAPRAQEGDPSLKYLNMRSNIHYSES